jgi:hypothetical protein
MEMAESLLRQQLSPQVQLRLQPMWLQSRKLILQDATNRLRRIQHGRSSFEC